MKKEKKIIVVISIILILVITIFSYFLINKNVIKEKQAEEIELQAMETNGSNSYVTTQEHLSEVDAINSSLGGVTITKNAILYRKGNIRELCLTNYTVSDGANAISIPVDDNPNYSCAITVYKTDFGKGVFGFYQPAGAWRLWSFDLSKNITGKVSGVITWVVE